LIWPIRSLRSRGESEALSCPTWPSSAQAFLAAVSIVATLFVAVPAEQPVTPSAAARASASPILFTQGDVDTHGLQIEFGVSPWNLRRELVHGALVVMAAVHRCAGVLPRPVPHHSVLREA